jgi:outer membrane biogenesis lipoprotein LolB
MTKVVLLLTMLLFSLPACPADCKQQQLYSQLHQVEQQLEQQLQEVQQQVAHKRVRMSWAPIPFTCACSCSSDRF